MDKETSTISLGFTHKIKNKFKDSEIYLFGSRARETNLVTSDFDFIVVSNKFDGMKLEKRIENIQSFWDYSRGADIICLTPKELKENTL